MTIQPGSLSPLRWGAAFAAGFAVFMLANLTASLIAFILPKTFASSTRILLKPEGQTLTNETTRDALLATQIELVRSDLVLGSVTPQLGLAVKSLREQLEIRPIPNTTMIEIRAFNTSPQEAVRIANLVASAYLAAFPNAGAQIVEKATLARKPVRPNKPVIIGLGAVGGFLLGGFVTAGVILLGFAKRQ